MLYILGFYFAKPHDPISAIYHFIGPKGYSRRRRGIAFPISSSTLSPEVSFDFCLGGHLFSPFEIVLPQRTRGRAAIQLPTEELSEPPLQSVGDIHRLYFQVAS